MNAGLGKDHEVQSKIRYLVSLLFSSQVTGHFTPRISVLLLNSCVYVSHMTPLPAFPFPVHDLVAQQIELTQITKGHSSETRGSDRWQG
jgi:hypothetical protein